MFAYDILWIYSLYHTERGDTNAVFTIMEI